MAVKGNGDKRGGIEGGRKQEIVRGGWGKEWETPKGDIH